MTKSDRQPAKVVGGALIGSTRLNRTLLKRLSCEDNAVNQVVSHVELVQSA